MRRYIKCFLTDYDDTTAYHAELKAVEKNLFRGRPTLLSLKLSELYLYIMKTYFIKKKNVIFFTVSSFMLLLVLFYIVK